MPGQSAHLPEAFVNIARSAGGSAAGAIPIVITNTPASKIILECVLMFSSFSVSSGSRVLVFGLIGTIQLMVSECNAPVVMGHRSWILADGLSWEALGSASRWLYSSGSRGRAADLIPADRKSR